MRQRLLALVVVAAGALVVTGCSSDVIDVPASAVVSEVPRASVTPSATPQVTADQAALDCAVALPASDVEAGIGLPAGTVTAGSSSAGVCTYTIAGNPAAVIVSLASARLPETFTGAGEAQGATPAPLGTAAYWVEGEGGTTPSEFAVLAGGYELHVVSYVGDRSTLVDWAVEVLAAVDVPLAVA